VYKRDVFWAFIHDWKYETYYRGQFESRYRPTAWQRLNLFISISIWGAFGTVSGICFWRQWWIEMIGWRIFMAVYYRVKRMLI
jgi:hypothetical protein